jgi:hypothetical protein
MIVNSSDPKYLDQNINPLLSSLVENNLSSHNIGSIVRVFLDKISHLKEEQTNDQKYVFITNYLLVLIYFISNIAII